MDSFPETYNDPKTPAICDLCTTFVNQLPSYIKLSTKLSDSRNNLRSFNCINLVEASCKHNYGIS